MSEFPQLSFVGLQSYEPYDGMGVGLLGREGIYKVKITSAVPEMSKDKQKGMVVVGCVVQDADGIGTSLIHTVNWRSGRALAVWGKVKRISRARTARPRSMSMNQSSTISSGEGCQ